MFRSYANPVCPLEFLEQLGRCAKDTQLSFLFGSALRLPGGALLLTSIAMEYRTKARIDGVFINICRCLGFHDIDDWQCNRKLGGLFC